MKNIFDDPLVCRACRVNPAPAGEICDPCKHAHEQKADQMAQEVPKPLEPDEYLAEFKKWRARRNSPQHHSNV